MQGNALVGAKSRGTWTGLLLAILFALSTACPNSSDKARSVDKTMQRVTSAKHVRLLCFLPWGNNGDDIGRLVPKEGAPEGPMSFDISPDGGLAVLDQVNQKILFVDPSGRPQASIPLSRTTFQDMKLLDDGAVALLDRLDRREVLVLSRAGDVLGKTPLEGTFVPEGGAVTALRLQPDGIWVEVEHRFSVLIADRRGRPVAKRVQVSGRVLGDATARLWRDSPLRATLVTKHAKTPSAGEASISLTYPEPIRLTGLVRLANGGFAVSAASLSASSKTPPMDRIYLDFIAPDGRTRVGRWTTLVPAMAEEVFQMLRPTPSGGVALLHLEEQGVSIEEVSP